MSKDIAGSFLRPDFRLQWSVWGEAKLYLFYQVYQFYQVLDNIWNQLMCMIFYIYILKFCIDTARISVILTGISFNEFLGKKIIFICDTWPW